MKATDLLAQQHRDLDQLFSALEGDGSSEKRCEIFEELASSLVAHDAIERDIFYPACEQALGMNDELGRALVEDGVIEFSLYGADRAQGEADFGFKCAVLHELVDRHVGEKEADFFPLVERAMSETQLEQLGALMEQRFLTVREADFRAPLHDNLRRVLAGTLAPRKLEPASGKPRKSA